MSTATEYKTRDITRAAFLVVKGYQVIRHEGQRPMWFVFTDVDPDVLMEYDTYSTASAAPARRLFDAFYGLKRTALGER